jgi:hypothetical protein
MRFSLAKIIASAALATFHFGASASLIDPLEYESNGLTWLKLSETTSLSLNDFATGVGGWNTQYRFALNSEIDALLASFRLHLGDTGYQQQIAGASDFMDAVGGMTEGGLAGTYEHGGTVGAKGRGLGRYVWVELTSGDEPEPLGPNCDAYFSCTRVVATAEQQLNIRESDTGLFLIRNDAVIPPPISVPEPSSLALIGAGALLAYHRRKKQQ